MRVEIHSDHLVAAKEALNNRMKYQLLRRIIKYSICHPFHATQTVNTFLNARISAIHDKVEEYKTIMKPL